MNTLSDEAIEAMVHAMTHRRIHRIGCAIVTYGPHPQPWRISVDRTCLLVRFFGWQLHVWGER